jgi:predicted alpha/beta superfamily hydrolase
MLKKTIMISLCALFVLPLFGEEPQDAGVKIGLAKTIDSLLLKEKRQIYVCLPSRYESNKNSYPVLYLLDGSPDNFHAVSGIVKFLEFSDIPEMIVVAIPNTNRGRDLSVEAHEQLPGSPGAAVFRQFLEKELLLFVEQNFRTSGYRIIAGNSAAGIFAVYALFKNPALFDAGIVGSPPFGWGWKEIEPEAEKYFSDPDSRPKFLYLSYSEGEGTHIIENLPDFFALIEKQRRDIFRYRIDAVPGNKHVPSRTFLNGLLELFDGWQPIAPPVFSPGSGLAAAGDRIQVKIGSEENEIRYTLDGSEPVAASPLYSAPVDITVPAVIKAKSCRGTLGQSRMTTAEFKAVAATAAMAKDNAKQKGLRYKLYLKDWFRLPDAIDLVPDKAGLADNIGAGISGLRKGYILGFEGYIDIARKGMHSFYLSAQARTKLFIDDQGVAEIPSMIEDRETIAVIRLAQGLHKFRLLFLNPWVPDAKLKLEWAGPGFTREEVPGQAFFH